MDKEFAARLREALGLVGNSKEPGVGVGGSELSSQLAQTPQVAPIATHKAVPVVPPETSSGTERHMITMKEVLVNILRPRLVSRAGKISWKKTYERMRQIRDYLDLFARRDILKAEESDDEFDILEAFFEAYPEARQEFGQGGSLYHFYYPNLLIDLESLESLLDPQGDIFKTYFSRLVSVPSVPGSASSRARSSEFSRFKEEVTRAYLALVEPKGGENYKDILRDFLGAYLSYASKLRSLPKPGLDGEGEDQ